MAFDQYEILGVAGVGAFATVHRARQAFTGRLVALKVVDRSGPIDERVIAAFERECAAMAAVEHPGVVAVYEAGLDASGTPYVAMELVDGGSVIDGAPLTVDRAIATIAEAADAVVAVHLAGVVHRDIKPANLLTTPSGGVKLVDFGSAVFVVQPGAAAVTVTLTADAPVLTAGTFPYMAPELFAGEPATVATDVYALGATLFELICGTPPFVDPADDSPARLSHRILDEPLGTLPSSIPRPLADLLRRTLAKDPADRPATAAVLAAELRAVGARLDAPVVEPAIAPGPTAPVAPGTHPRAVESDADVRARAEDGDVDAMFRLAVALKQRGAVDDAVTWYECAAAEGHEPSMNNLGVLLRNAGDPVEAEQWFRRAAERGNDSAMHNLAVLLAGAGRTAEAERWFVEAAEFGNALAMNSLGLRCRTTGRVDSAAHWFRRAATLGHVGAMYQLGLVLREAGRPFESRHWLRRATGLGHQGAAREVDARPSHPPRAEEAEQWYRRAADLGDTDAMDALGARMQADGRLDEAEHWWLTASEQGDADAMFRLGGLLRTAGRTAEAERWYRAAADRGHEHAKHTLLTLVHSRGRHAP